MVRDPSASFPRGMPAISLVRRLIAERTRSAIMRRPSLLSCCLLAAVADAEGLVPSLQIERRSPLGRRLPVASRVATSSIAAPLPALQNKPLLMAAAAEAEAPTRGGISTAWGVCGFLSILASAIGRLLPIALQPLSRKDLGMLQVVLYGGSVATFAYVEGYGAFQKKFSPLVVRRALTLARDGTPFHHRLLAPFYSMGLFHASKKRKIVSWTVSLTVGLLVGIVKRLPYPWRSIVDAGVCAGLCWGGTSIMIIYAKALLSGTPPDVSAELP